MSFGEKLLLGAGAAVLLGAAVGALASRHDDADDLDDDDLDDDDHEASRFRPGRRLELSVLGLLDAVYGEHDVLDNPTLGTDCGRLIKPDAVVLGKRGVREVRECKDVERLRTSHVHQAFDYDWELEPIDGTTLDVPKRTEVSDAVEELAHDLGIDIERWDE